MRKYHNENRPPPVHYLLRLSELFGVPLDWLATGHGSRHSANVEEYQATKQEMLEGMLDELIRGPTIPPALQDPTIRSLLAQTVRRKLEIEAEIRRALDGNTTVSRSEVVQWLNELVAHVMHPSDEGLLLSWDLPTPDEMGDEAWLSAALGTLQGVLARLSDKYLMLRTEQAAKMSEAANPEIPPASAQDIWIKGGDLAAGSEVDE